MRSGSVLLVNLGAALEDAIASECRRRGLSPVLAAAEAATITAGSDFGLCLIAVRGSSERGYEQVRSLSEKLGTCPIVVLAEGTGPEIPFRLARIRVAEVIALPTSPRDIGARAFAHFAEIGEFAGTAQPVGRSPAMVELVERAGFAARVRSTVLLQGETGVGKGVFAQAIHDWSRWAHEPFVHVECAALSPTLIESELFGHEKGAFTGADGLRRGRCEMARTGTLFLDEIGDLDQGLQSKLLRLLENRTFERVGGSKTLFLRARVIAATSRNLFESVQAGQFRRDLYYRLNVLSLRIPPLRARREDLPELAQAGLQRLSESLGISIPRVGDDFYEHLGDYSWPGNVRELMNVLERLLVERHVTVLEASDLDAVLPPLSPPERSAASDELAQSSEDDEEAAVIVAALIDTGGNISRAARRLDMPRGTLRYKIIKKKLRHLIPRD